VLGRIDTEAIARAAEAEALLETLAAMLDPKAEPGRYAGRRASDTLKDLRSNAHRCPRAEQLILDLCDAAEEGQEHRNWLVHSHVVPSLDGEWAELQKPARREERWDRRRFKAEQVNRIAARFAWVFTAVSYAVNLLDEETAATVIEPLGPPPPVDFDWSPVPGPGS
jgi:hypothetical protein